MRRNSQTFNVVGNDKIVDVIHLFTRVLGSARAKMFCKWQYFLFLHAPPPPPPKTVDLMKRCNVKPVSFENLNKKVD